jgi:hypothetical protein
MSRRGVGRYVQKKKKKKEGEVEGGRGVEKDGKKEGFSV